MYDDHAGKKFGKLLVTAESDVRVLPNGKRSRVWHCICDCGGNTWVRRAALVNGNTKSCGCYSAEKTRSMFTKHGHSAGGAESPTYYSWHNMMKRCTIPKAKQYSDYGGRGIKICPEWFSFERFLADMGERPDGCTLDRREVDGDYTKENCRWATKATQSRNRRSNRLLTFNGNTMCVTDWAAQIGISEATLRGRLDRGWSLDRALTKPARSRK